MATASKIKVDIQSGTDRTVYATWAWTKSHTDHYAIKWYYGTGDGVWFVGESTTTTSKQSTYNAPSNASKVGFKVKPVAKTHKVKKKTVAYWSADWSSLKQYKFSSNPPSTPSAPTVTIEDYTLTASLANLNVNATSIQFQVVKNDKSVFNTGTATIKTYAASYSCTVTAGAEYKVRCRAVKGKEYSAWSEFSSNVGTIPAASPGITELKALSETSIYVDWDHVSNATSYELEYTTQIRYFDSSTEVKSMTIGDGWSHAEVTGLETGEEYFFRVRSVNDKGHSAWTAIKSLVIGKAPSAPTTWSSTTTVIVGESLFLYWVHNAEDGSSQTYAELELTIDGVTETHTIKNSTDEDEKDKTSSYSVNTLKYAEGSQIQWRVRTAGVTKEYGDWSIQRTVDIYAPPTLELSMTDVEGNAIETLTSFPFYISGLAGPNTQAPIGYHLAITSNEIYETVDQIGNAKMVNAGEQVYSKYFDTSDQLIVELSAGNLDLENGVTYTVTCVSTMNSGLTAESSLEFMVDWDEVAYEPNAEIGIDEDTLSALIRPYCEYYPVIYYKVNYNSQTGVYTATTEAIDEIDGNLVADVYTDTGEEVYSGTDVNGNTVYFYMVESEEGTMVEGITLAVYRREFDGRFVELAKGIENLSNTYITDPHPALDYARYRVVATATSTGAVCYYDLPGYPVNEKSVIIQWDEAWSYFDPSGVNEEDELEQPPWSGSLLKLPYNIDVSDSNKSDVALIEYIGRSHPVSYYGTQLGATSTWNVEIEKGDEETLYALRRLAIWMGDVYVREPSGSGYWANVSVSFSQKHCELSIPVTLEISRVEGGV